MKINLNGEFKKLSKRNELRRKFAGMLNAATYLLFNFWALAILFAISFGN